MFRISHWLNHRAFRQSRTWLSFLILGICSLIVSGGVTRRDVLNLDIMLLNVAYSTAFRSIEEFKEWFDFWQFKRLMGAFGQICLFPIAVRLFPYYDSPDVRIPVSIGYRRSQVWFASMGRFVVEIMILSCTCTILGGIASGIHFADDAPLVYYLRCVLLHIWRDIGFAGMALFFAMLIPKRIPGICFSFGFMLLLAVLGTNGLFDGTALHIIASSLSEQVLLWLWQINMNIIPSEMVFLLTFPFITFGAATVIGIFRYNADLQ